MTDEFEEPAEPILGPPLLVGPFTYHSVVVDGRVIPRLTGNPDGPAHTMLILDGRFSHSFPNEHVRQAAWMIANALAIGQGYSHLGALTKDMPFAPQAMEIGHGDDA